MKFLLLCLLALPAVAQAAPNAWTAIDALEVTEFTKAPRRATAQARLNAPVKTVWAYLSDHSKLPEYAKGIIESVEIDASGAKEANGVGTKRACDAGKDKFVEEIVFFEAPYVFAYSAFENTWGLKDHLAVVSLKPDGNGGTLIVWDQYFNHMQPKAAPMVAKNLRGMLRGAILPALTKKFGGQVL